MDDLLLTALLEKAKRKEKLVSAFGSDHILIIDDPSDPKVFMMAVAKPVLGLRDGEQPSPEYLASRQYEEELVAELWIYSQRFKTMDDTMVGSKGILTLVRLVREAFDGDVDFSNTVYDGPQIVECHYRGASASAAFNRPKLPAMMRKMIRFGYLV